MIIIRKVIMRLLFIISGSYIPLFISGQNNAQSDAYADTSRYNVFGYEFLNRIPGQWNGPVYSATTAGSFDKWYVDFRPVSAGQVSQYSLLDTQTVNIISFFIVNYNGRLKVAMRTEGCFQEKCCVTYEIMDSVNEAEGYYGFCDFISCKNRAYTDFRFKDDGFVMKVYTNKFNREKTLSLHSEYKAKLIDRKVASEASSVFGYPRPVIIKDFTGVFKNMTESIFFNPDMDPYSSSSQPYIGSITVNISVDKKLKTKFTDELCLVITTVPLFEGIKYNEENLNYISKSLYLPVEIATYTIGNVHPGKYYLYSFADINNDKKYKKGDYMSSDLNNTFTVKPKENVTVNTKIDFVIPY